jgi:predicted AlkP superfamily phosphohydrolase/phosphomutase/Flp pilus assembly protein TadD
MPRIAPRVLLIGWDAADWKFASPLLEAGKMPNLQRMVEGGVMGNLATLSPILSPILWTTIATGRYADEHGILGFAEPDPASGSARPVRSTSRRCSALWNILSRHGLNVAVVHWLASHPAEQVNGCVVSDHFIAEAVRRVEDPSALQAVWPPDLAADLAPVLVGPRDVTPLQVAPFVNLADSAVRADPRTDRLIELLAHTASTHALATLLMQTEPWDFMAVYYEGIDRFSHAFMQYHPPRAPHVPEAEFECFREVMTGCYRFHDMLLGRLLELAGEDTLVLLVSDHGFHSDSLRPGESPAIRDGEPVAWHSRQGLLAASGPGLQPDHLVFGASLLDIAPTILAALGLAVPRDMPGQVLHQMWPAGTLTWDTVPTHETAEPGPVAADGQAPEDPWAAAQMLRRLIELGYMEDESLEKLLLEKERTLGTVFASTHRPAQAIAHYEAVLRECPEDLDTALALARCLLAVGQTEAAAALTRRVLETRPEGPGAHLLMARALLLSGDSEAALEHLLTAEQADPRLPHLHTNLGAVHVRRRDWAAAERAFRRALEIDPHTPAACTGLGIALRNQGQAEQAVEALMRSVGLLHHQVEAHLELALSLLDTGRVDWAIRALHTALELDSDDPRAHNLLAAVYHTLRPDPARSVYHEARARQLSQPPAD